MRKLHALERYVLLQLRESVHGLNAFTLSRRHKIGPNQLASAASRLSSLGLIICEGSHLAISEIGKEFMLKSGMSEWSAVEKPWRKCPEEFKKPAIEPNEPIVPWLPMVDDSIVPSGVRN